LNLYLRHTTPALYHIELLRHFPERKNLIFLLTEVGIEPT
jgi:hypothetical protein